MMPLTDLLEAFSGVRVLVVGEAMLDCYIEGEASRLCPEAPAPVVSVAQRRHLPGGAANTALNVAALGGRARFVSVVGDDAAAADLATVLVAGGVDVSPLVVVPGRRSLAKSRVLVDSQVLLRFDEGDTEPPPVEPRRRIVAELKAAWQECDAVVISDYGYGVLSPDVIAALAKLQRSRPRLVVADAKDLAAYRDVRPDAVKPNHLQAAALVDAPPGGDRVQEIAARADVLLQRTGARLAAVTFDRDGTLFLEAGREPYRTYTRPGMSSRAAGAGDTFVATLSLALAVGADVPSAGEVASAAAAEVLGHDGTAACPAMALKERFRSRNKRVEDVAAFGRFLDELKAGRRTIVFTNGCFDILHRGHVTFLNRAKSLGDVLVVAVNSDDSVRRLKGSERPVNSLADRIEVLAALSSVDYVVPFEEETPVELLCNLQPDVFVKGGDYTLEQLPERRVVEERGGRVEILPYLEDHSTTSIVERIRRERTERVVRLDEVSHAG